MTKISVCLLVSPGNHDRVTSDTLSTLASRLHASSSTRDRVDYSGLVLTAASPVLFASLLLIHVRDFSVSLGRFVYTVSEALVAIVSVDGQWMRTLSTYGIGAVEWTSSN